jgi:MFS family permease
MITEHYIGRPPSHFQMNPLVKAFIISEAFLWGAWNFITPIFGLFVVNEIKGGNIEIVAFTFSFYLIIRVIVELISSKRMANFSDKKKLKTTIFGMVILSLSYIGFAFASEVYQVYVIYGLTGIGLGIATPAKNSLFSAHLDKNKEPEEWGTYDAITFIGMAFATALGGLFATQYGFSNLFILASIINGLGIIPYLLSIR